MSLNMCPHDTPVAGVNQHNFRCGFAPSSSLPFISLITLFLAAFATGCLRPLDLQPIVVAKGDDWQSSVVETAQHHLPIRLINPNPFPVQLTWTDPDCDCIDRANAMPSVIDAFGDTVTVLQLPLLPHFATGDTTHTIPFQRIAAATASSAQHIVRPATIATKLAAELQVSGLIETDRRTISLPPFTLGSRPESIDIELEFAIDIYSCRVARHIDADSRLRHVSTRLQGPRRALLSVQHETHRPFAPAIRLLELRLRHRQGVSFLPFFIYSEVLDKHSTTATAITVHRSLDGQLRAVVPSSLGLYASEPAIVSIVGLQDDDFPPVSLLNSRIASLRIDPLFLTGQTFSLQWTFLDGDVRLVDISVDDLAY